MIRLNLRLLQVFQYLQQFKLDVCYKLGKEYIILNVLSQLTSANTLLSNPQHLELKVLFTYNTTLVEIYPTMISQILASYKANLWWAQL